MPAAGSARGLDARAPNPQGKGLVGLLLDWQYSRPRGVVAKPPGRVLADYFTSLLVLSADFGFKPAYGQTYHLYREGSRWRLSLVAPHEWRSAEKKQAYVGACVLHDDSTWSIEPSGNLGKPGPLADALVDVYAGFLERLGRDGTLEDELPFYEGRLPYYQRLFAAALGRSLRGSLALGGQSGRPGAEWLASLPRDARKLLARGETG